MGTLGESPTVAIVDNDRFTRRAIRQVLEDGGFSVVWDRASGLAAEHLVMQTQTRPDVLLLDMSLDEQSGVEVCRSIRRSIADIRILGITAFPPDIYAGSLAQAGAQGLVTKESDRQLLSAIHALLDGGTYCPQVPSVTFSTATKAFTAQQKTRAKDESPLTDRERAVLESYERTGSYKITASQLGISDSTARNIMHHAKRRLGATSTAAAIVAWHERQPKKARR
ncbi:response regulator transcription factor [Bifidobacterium eulemuris]|uniref:DNA-binding response regulator n=1 Tax=Bifidobacterium eulemuris TaxID=1765219 RepID=A0A261GCN5_9BIFI|nr:response regulator transcription factor [Bifidobacterium eulemuris]OZG69174.1 DNA-binding response regulator [Bifidobacterium eulemuris]QOL31313.1 response regulator transcription factor [Bifidobacterium eulemuris]